MLHLMFSGICGCQLCHFFLDGENVEEELERTNMIRKSGINNPERFVCDLFTAFVLQLISLEYKKKDYDVYSISIDVKKN